MRCWMSAGLISAGIAALSCQSRPAQAADYPQVYPQYQPAGVVQEFVSGWYLRGDIGLRTDFNIGSVVSNFPLPSGSDIREVGTIGAGGGFKYGWFRSDVTVDYAGRAKYSGDGKLLDAFTAKVESTTALANFYVDFGTWSGLTPYVGVGAGGVWHRAYDYQAPKGLLTVDYQTHGEFAWAYMAGVSWCFSPRWLVDFSFRRVNLGEINLNPLLANELKLKDITANDFRIGLRYNFD